MSIGTLEAATGGNAPAAPKYRAGINDGVDHAVQDSYRPLSAADPRTNMQLARSVCGAIVSVAPSFGEFGRDNRAWRTHCIHCRWIVALHRGTTDAELRGHIAEELDAGLTSAAERVSTILKAILDSDGGEDGLTGYETEGRITKFSTVLAHISSHAPKLLVCEDCGDGVDCDHPDRTSPGTANCPGRLVVCGACTAFSGSWAGEWEGHSLDECTVKFPCSAITAAANHALALTQKRGQR